MNIKDLISTVLVQMAEIGQENYKKSYLVEDIVFELSLSQTETGEIGARLMGIGGRLNNEADNSQKVTIKLKPKSSTNDKIEIRI